MRKILLISLLFTWRIAFSQQFAPKEYYLIDSLELQTLSAGDSAVLESSLKRYHESPSDTGRINALNEICDGMMHDDWIKYQFYQYDLINKSLAANPSKEITQALYKSLSAALTNMGYICTIRGDVDQALEYYDQALRMQEYLGDLSRQAQTLNNIGVVRKKQGNFPIALEVYHKALKIQEETNDQLGIAGSYLNIGSAHLSMEDDDLALEYYFKALKANQAIDSKLGISNALNNIGVVYRKKKDLAKALDYFTKSLDIKLEIGDNSGLPNAYINIGTVNQDLGNQEAALRNLSLARKLSEETRNATGQASSYFSLAKLKFQAGEIAGPDGALDLATSSLRIAEEIGFPDKIRDASELLYKIYEDQGKAGRALEMLALFVQMKDSVSNLENQRATTRRQAQYEYETQKALDDKEHEKRLALEIEEKEKQKIVVYATTVGLVLLIGFLAYATNRLKVTRRQKRTIESQKKEVERAYLDLNAEKEKSDELLLNILPEEVAEELKETGKAEAKIFDSVTVLFTDFKGFTSVAERLTATELVREINTCFSAFDQIMEKYHVEKIKTIGDAYMAAGGLPVPNETHARDVVQVALEIQAFMVQLAEEKKAKGEPFFEIRIGVHSGPVIAGIVGLKKFQYDIWGDTVNTASRMESSGVSGKVNVSAATWELIRENPEFAFESRGEIKAKGKGMLQMYFVERKETSA